MTKSEQFFRQTRQIFAGIVALFQENLTRHGGKIVSPWAFRRFEDMLREVFKK